MDKRTVCRTEELFGSRANVVLGAIRAGPTINLPDPRQNGTPLPPCLQPRATPRGPLAKPGIVHLFVPALSEPLLFLPVICYRKDSKGSPSDRTVKRFVSLFLLFSYLLSSPGLVYSMHYCGQALTAVSVAQGGDTHCCCRDSGKPATGCCHDKKVASGTKDVKLTAAHSQLLAPALVPAPGLLPAVWQLAQAAYPAQEPAARPAVTAAPPPECPAYVRGHAFLI